MEYNHLLTDGLKDHINSLQNEINSLPKELKVKSHLLELITTSKTSSKTYHHKLTTWLPFAGNSTLKNAGWLGLMEIIMLQQDTAQSGDRDFTTKCNHQPDNNKSGISLVLDLWIQNPLDQSECMIL